MRVEATLEAEQKKTHYKGLVKIVLTLTGSTTQTYTASRILDIKYNESDKQSAEVLLDNADGAVSAINFRGYKGVISGGATISGVDVYSPKPPLWVVGQQDLSWEGRLACLLSLAGVMNFLDSEGANARYAPDDTNTDTVKTIMTAIARKTLACYSHAHDFAITFTSEDSLIDSFQPKDFFRIAKNESRLSAMKKLLSWTQMVMRVDHNGTIQVFGPTTSSSSYNYTYELGAGNHAFFSLSHRKRIVIPHYVQVDSHPTTGDSYTGYYEDPDTAALVAIDSTIGQKEFLELRVEDDIQAVAIATARMLHYQLQAEKGSANVPMNFLAEVYDYVNCIDSRDGDTSRAGNIGYIKTHYSYTGRTLYSPSSWGMNFGFGKVGFGLAGTALTQLGGVTDLSSIMPILEWLISMIEAIIEFLETLEGYDLGGFIWVDAAGNIHIRPKSGQDTISYEDFIVKVTNDANLGSATKEWLAAYIKKAYHDTRLQIPVGTDMYD